MRWTWRLEEASRPAVLPDFLLDRKSLFALFPTPSQPRDVMIAMLRREDELRTCDDTQKKYAEAEQSNSTDWMEVTFQLAGS